MVASDLHSVNKGSSSRAMIFYLISSTRQLAYGGMETTDSQVFQKDVTFAAASNRHFREQFKAAHNDAAPARKIQFGNGTAARVQFFTDKQFAPTRGGKLKRSSTLMSEEDKVGVAEEEVISISQ